MSGLSGRQKWEWLGTTSITFSGEEDLVCMYWRDPPLASAPSPGTNLGADTQGPGAKGQTAPGVGPDPLLLLLIVSISNLMMHVQCTYIIG